MLTPEVIRKKFGTIGSRRPQKAVCQQVKAEARMIAQNLDHIAKKAGRDFTDEEQAQYSEAVALVEYANDALAEDAKYATFEGAPRGESASFDLSGLVPGGRRTAGEQPSRSGLTGDALAHMKAIGDWMQTGHMDYMAADVPLNIQQAPISIGLADAIPVVIVNALRAYYLVDSFKLAGSTQYMTDSTVPLVKPVISSGADADEFDEGQSSTDSHPMAVDSFTFGGQKYSRLVKASMESIMNSALDLPTEIMAELASSVAQTFTKKTTADCLAALQGNPACFVDNGTDAYGALSGLIAAVPPRFADASNVFMGSRAAKLRVNNSRDTQARPLFDQESNLTLGYPWVNNDNLVGGRVIFGDFGSGAYVRKTPFFLQRLIEVYSDKGQIGFRATQFLDSKFLASVHSVASQPLYFTSLETEGS